MKERISVEGTSVFIKLIHGPHGRGQAGLILKWYEGLDFAEALVDACDEARRNAESDHCVPHDRKNT